MFELTKAQKSTLRTLATNCAGIIFATLIIGVALAPIFYWQIFLLGCILFTAFSIGALLAER